MALLTPTPDAATRDAAILNYYTRITGSSRAADSLLADLDNAARDVVYEKIVRPDSINTTIDRTLIGQKIKQLNLHIDNFSTIFGGILDNINGDWTINSINSGKTFTISKLISITVSIDNIRGI